MYINFIVVCLMIKLVQSDPISFTECDVDTNIGKLDSLNIPGDPICVGTNEPLVLSLSGNINKPVTDDVDLVLQIQKQISVLGIKKWISVPCIDGYGSCTQKLIDYVQSYNETFVCDFLTKMGKPCSMPFQPGQYTIADYSIPIDLSKIPSPILSLGSGKIKVHIEIKTDVTLYCIDVSADLKLESDLDDDEGAEEASNYGGERADYNPFWQQ